MGEEEEVNTELFNSLAKESLSIFRINLILIGLYLSALALLHRSSGPGLAESIVGASYTQIGIFAWVGSLVSSVLFYRRARRISIQEEYYDESLVSDELISINLVSASAFAAATSVILFILGILEGFSGQTPPLTFPIVAIGLFIGLFVFLPWSVLSILDIVAQRYRRIRDIIYLFV